MKKVAISKADFKEIIKNNFIYVDKTKYLHEIVSSRETYYFLSRPRRFGKSLFLSTLENFFKGRKELFRDLYIYKQEWEWEEYPVLKLDFNKIPSENRGVLEKGISDNLLKVADKYDVDLDCEEPYFMFSKLVEKLSEKYNKGVVLLIDEYDKPIISKLGKDMDKQGDAYLKEVKKNQEFLKIFYDNLKPLESNLRLVFITGVSKFSKVSIFSTLNNLIELDMHPRFVDMLGYTEEELIKNFGSHFESFAEQLGIEVGELVDKFRVMYDGFRFSDEDIKVYNPYSVGKALDYQKIDNYWFESGTPTFLVDLIKERDFDVKSLDRLEIGRDEIKAYDLEKLQLIPLLFQTGYLTIKDIEDQIIYTLGYPNKEVEKGFTLNLIKSFSENKIGTPIIHKVKKALINREYEQFIKYMKSLFGSIASLNIPKDLQQREQYYHTIFYLTGVLLSDDNLGVYSELLTSEGRIDMVVKTEEVVFIIEFKCNQSAEQAIEQIRKKNYTERFMMEEKASILMGINFDTEKKNIGEFEIYEKEDI